MRQRVVRVLDADLGVGAAGQLPSQHEADHPREIRPIGEHLQVEHQLDVIAESGRDARRLIDDRKIRGALLFCLLNAPLDVAHGVEILRELVAIGGVQRPLDVGNALGDRVEQALVRPEPHHARRPIGGVVAAEHPLEHRPRVVLHRQRRGRASPGDRVGVGAAESSVARSGEVARVDAELERRQLGLASELARRNLIHRHARFDLTALPGDGPAADDPGEKLGRGVSVIAAALTSRRPLRQSRHDDQPIAIALQRLQHRRDFEGLPHRLRRPVRHRHPIREIDDTEAADAPGGSLGQGRERRYHRIEERQRERRPEPPQHRPSRQRFSGDEHRSSPRGFAPSDSPTRSLARRFVGALRSRDSLARSHRSASRRFLRQLTKINPDSLIHRLSSSETARCRRCHR